MTGARRRSGRASPTVRPGLGAAVGAVTLVLALSGCQVASSPPTLARTATPVARATTAASAPNATAPSAVAPSPTQPPRSPTVATTGTTSGTALARTPTRPAPTVEPTARPVAATPARPTANPTPATAALPGGPTATRPAPTGGLLPSGGEQLSGEVTSFAASARVLLLRASAGAEQQVSLAPDAVVRRSGGAAATTADLRPGSRVQVSGRRGADGTLIADQVTLLSTP